MMTQVFPDGLVASDGRLQPGDQIIEINGCDMTCATHSQVRGQGSHVTNIPHSLPCIGVLIVKPQSSPNPNPNWDWG